MATDFVVIDDLHPYRGSKYIRRDVSATMVLAPHRQRNEVDSNKLVIVLKHAVFEKLHRPERANERSELHALYRSMTVGATSLSKACVIV